MIDDNTLLEAIRGIDLEAELKRLEADHYRYEQDRISLDRQLATLDRVISLYKENNRLLSENCRRRTLGEWFGLVPEKDLDK